MSRFCANSTAADTCTHVRTKPLSDRKVEPSAQASKATATHDKAARLAAQLRANLKKRKSQQRGRLSPSKVDPSQQT